MKYILIFLLLFTFLFVTSCEECGECFSPPAPFVFELVNTEGENVFTNGAYNSAALSINNVASDQRIDFEFISENDLNLVQLLSIGWETEKVNLSFQLKNEEVFTFYVDAERLSEDCCSFTRYSEIILEGANFEVDSQSGTYKVIVE